MGRKEVEIVETNAETYGLNAPLDAIGLPRSTWYHWKDSKIEVGHLHEPLIQALNDNPAYGYRRVESELEARWLSPRPTSPPPQPTT